MDLEISLNELRLVTEKIYAYLVDELGINSVRISEDYYWSIDVDKKFLIERKPEMDEMGQLTDDWMFLSSALLENSNIHPAMLCHLIPLLEYLFHKYGKQYGPKI